MPCPLEPEGTPRSSASIKHDDTATAALALALLYGQSQDVPVTRCTTATTQIFDAESCSETGSISTEESCTPCDQLQDTPCPTPDAHATLSKRQLDHAFAPGPPTNQGTALNGGGAPSAFSVVQSKRPKVMAAAVTAMASTRPRKVVMATPVQTRQVVVSAMATSGTSRPSGLGMGMGMGSTRYIQAGDQPGFVAGIGPQAEASFRGQPKHAAPIIPGAQNNGRRKVVMATGMPTTPLLPVGPWGSWGSRPLAQ